MSPDYEFVLDEGAPVPKTGFWAYAERFGVKVGPFSSPVAARNAEYPKCGGSCCAGSMGRVAYERPPQPEGHGGRR